MSKIREVVIHVELWDKDRVLAVCEAAIPIPDARPINKRNLTDASQRAVANLLELLEENLDNQ